MLFASLINILKVILLLIIVVDAGATNECLANDQVQDGINPDSLPSEKQPTLKTLLTELKVRPAIQRNLKSEITVETVSNAVNDAIRTAYSLSFYGYFFADLPKIREDKLVKLAEKTTGQKRKTAVSMIALAGLYCRDTNYVDSWKSMIRVISRLADQGDSLATELIVRIKLAEGDF
jgi:hypothetical protein